MADPAVVAEYARALEAARRREVAAVRDIERLVVEARMVGLSWASIGTALGMSKQAAWERFHHP